MHTGLPSEITEKASLCGKEFAWRLDEFLPALVRAASIGFACIGGQFQFRAPNGTCEMHWLAVDAGNRERAEPWPDYVARCEREVREAFTRIVREAHFGREAGQFDYLREKIASDNVDLLDCLRFVAYFIGDDAPNT